MKKYLFITTMVLSLVHSALLRGSWLIAAPFDQHYADIAHAFLNNPEAIDKDQAQANKLALAPFALSAQGAVLKSDDSYDDMDQFLDNAPLGSVAVIQIKGATMKDDFCGWPGTNTIASWISKSDAHSNTIGQIILMDTPGGSADGPAHLNQVIKSTKKPTLVYVDGLMASAGVFIGCSADHIMANSRAAMIGSIGTMTTLRDYSDRYKELGIKEINIVSDLSPLKNKAYFEALQGNQQPLKDEVLNPLTQVFHDFVRTNRNLSSNESGKAPLDGRMYLADQAKEYGLIDSIGNLQDAVRWVINHSSIKSSQIKVV